MEDSLCLRLAVPADLDLASGGEGEATEYVASCSRDPRWTGLIPDGEMKFDWRTGVRRDAASKWNWLVIQAFYGGRAEMEAVDRWLSGIGARAADWSAIERMDDRGEAYIDWPSVLPRETIAVAEAVGVWRLLADGRCRVCGGDDDETGGCDEDNERVGDEP